jgi:NAD(P)-dependent dehydrogenase (short-subunit alcohol dehydrogenase family)
MALDLKSFPKHFGFTFTPTIHNTLSKPTKPENNKLPSPFVVLVTGAGKGLGFHISLAYAKAGANGIIITSRTKFDLDSLEKKILDINSECQVFSAVCDTTRKSDLDDLAAKTKEKYGRLDVIVANAGVMSKYLSDGTLPSTVAADEDFSRVININIIGSALTAQSFLPVLASTPYPVPAHSLAYHPPPRTCPRPPWYPSRTIPPNLHSIDSSGTCTTTISRETGFKRSQCILARY